MDILDLFKDLKSNYKTYIKSFSFISDPYINEKVEEAFQQELLLGPKERIQFNPAYKTGRTVEQIRSENNIDLHEDLSLFFPNQFYQHQEDALILGSQDKEFVVTSGTGSGKSRTYIATIFNYLLNHQASTHDKTIAIIVYPMNALINSQYLELEGYMKHYEEQKGDIKSFITYGKYTGQENSEERDRIKKHPCNILLTNYMMLELLLTRESDKELRENFLENLKFIVFDELHTYRGMQGVDVSLLIRRIKALAKNEKVLCFGTSATMVADKDITSDDRKRKVAEVATCIFGSSFTKEQIIEETLDIRTEDKVYSAENLRQCILDNEITLASNKDLASIEKNLDYIRSFPTAIWIEHNIALKKDTNNQYWRNDPKTIDDIAKELCVAAELDQNSEDNLKSCAQHITSLLKACNTVNQDLIANNKRTSILPFKIHQFIKQTGNVYATLGRQDSRLISFKNILYLDRKSLDDNDPRDKAVLDLVECCDNPCKYYPLVFSRATGHEFYVVDKRDGQIYPRDPDEKIFVEDPDEDDGNTFGSNSRLTPGYIIIPHDGQDINDFLVDEDEEEFPNSWYQRGKKSLISEKRQLFPQLIYLKPDGTLSSENEPGVIEAIFIKAPLKVEPTAHVLFDRTSRALSDYAHLSKIGGEGRSTATTILAYESIALMKQRGVEERNLKLLNFVDARQDASLQSGHFNDFVLTVKIRAAILQAVRKTEIIEYKDLAGQIFEKLGFDDIKDYANDPELAPSQREKCKKAMRDCLKWLIDNDLAHNWSVNIPNLEDCYLIKVKYPDIEAVAEQYAKSDCGFWAPFKGNKQAIIELLILVFEFFRKKKALDSDFKDTASTDGIKGEVEYYIKPQFFNADKLNSSSAIFIDEKPYKHRYSDLKSAGRRSYFGRRLVEFIGKKNIVLDKYISEEKAYAEFTTALFENLKEFIKCVQVTNQHKTYKVFQLKPNNISLVKWNHNDDQKNDYEQVHFNRSPLQNFTGYKHKENWFYKNLYATFPLNDCALKAKEHTGQIDKEERKRREVEFSEGKFPILFCSPTMELGIDIKDLSIVGMRNVPPTPANYTQRAGRAGRNGQAALVYTFCRTKNSHDNFYLQHPEKMINGVVQAPKMDLLNEDLIKAHLHSLILTIKPIDALGKGIGDIINTIPNDDVDMPDFGLMPEIKDSLKLSDQEKDKVKACFEKLIDDPHFQPLIEESKKLDEWYPDEKWLQDQIDKYEFDFDAAFNRCRELLTALYSEHNKLLENQKLKNRKDKEKNSGTKADLVLNKIDFILGSTYGQNQSFAGQDNEFYPYRYLASEGFLPGYNFVKLPIRALLDQNDKPLILSRPKSYGLKEFSPFNTIYCNGAKFKIKKMFLNSSTKPEEFKFNSSSGYLIKVTNSDGYKEKIPNFDPLTGSKIDNLLPLGSCLPALNMYAQEEDSIHCFEEERISNSYQVQPFLSCDSKSIKQISVKDSQQQYMNIMYIHNCRITYVLSTSSSKKESHDFTIDTDNGLFVSNLSQSKKKSKDENQQKDTNIKVKLYAEDNANALYISIDSLLFGNNDYVGSVITFAYAFKKAIEATLNVESAELNFELVGDKKIFIFENSEGSLGVLKKVIEEEVFKNIIKKAYEICYQDKEYLPGSRELENLTPADYSNLLSYYNQPYHEKIDIRKIYVALKSLKDGNIKIENIS